MVSWETLSKPEAATITTTLNLSKFFCISHIGPASHRIKRILHSNNIIKVYHSSRQKVYQVFTRAKTKRTRTWSLVHTVFHVNAVWFTPYLMRRCNVTKRQKEHLNCCIKEKSSIAEHAWICATTKLIEPGLFFWLQSTNILCGKQETREVQCHRKESR